VIKTCAGVGFEIGFRSGAGRLGGGHDLQLRATTMTQLKATTMTQLYARWKA
jgi:hypothetical protein